ncbi:MAG: CcmD family protein [Dehalococcoidia bacterium]|nr:CcmD family protein [Dehalococcoidia bacterium]MDP7089785.1 CcmD family protein [Dehalococcoidia bacterium]MDP7261456.1 CcmD family protein [Dehalococcoidia bacterium]MDP7484774.1 CcmD family protein [Dehalococcoidia bacterium]
MKKAIVCPGIGTGTARLAIALILALSATTALSQSSSAQDKSILSGIVVGVETDNNDRLTRFAVSDSTGTVTTFELSTNTEFGLENQSGDRWVSSQGEEPAESARRLRDHRERFAPITVSSQNGIATSVVEREEGKLETNLGYLFAVFAITWALFFAYVLYMGRKQRVLQHEIAKLKSSIANADRT